MVKVPNAVKIFRKVSTAWVGRMSVTDDRQTDDRQTDGRQQIAKKPRCWEETVQSSNKVRGISPEVGSLCRERRVKEVGLETGVKERELW